MQVNVVVELDLAEVYKAITEAAKEKVGKDAQGGSGIEITYDGGLGAEAPAVSGARVKFQYQKK